MEEGRRSILNGWRSIVFREKSDLSVRDNQLIASGKQESAFPLEQLRQIMISSQGSSISVAAITASAREHVRIVLCGDRHIPVCEIVPIDQHHEASGAVMDQAEWTQDRKDLVWKSIVESKLRNQLALLKILNRNPSPVFREYTETVEPGDKTHREAVAARMYFHSLFGTEFRRHAEDEINAKLNYGYTILCSAISRILGMHRYHTGLGIHHCSRGNPVNLSCDLMEPFRPFVDRIVYQSGDQPMDWEMRKSLIALTNKECLIDGKRTDLDFAMETYCLKALQAVRTGHMYLAEVSLV